MLFAVPLFFYVALPEVTFSLSLSELTFGGDGSRNEWGDIGNYEYKFSSGFQDDICSTCTNFLSYAKNNCWGAQGISSYDNYLIRSFYEKGTSSDCDGRNTAGNHMSNHIAISVIKKEENPTYSNILVRVPIADLGFSCHAGDVALNKIDGTYWFLVACSSKVVIFSENAIQSVDAKSVNSKNFYYYINSTMIKIRELDDVSFSFISRNDGQENEYWSGKYSTSSSTSGLNLKLISIDPDRDWNISVIQSYTVSSSVAKKVQGATRIGDSMYITTSSRVRRCSMEDNDIGWCFKQCEIEIDYCAGIKNRDMVLQGAETDQEGYLYVGSEFGACQGLPFYQLKVFDHGSSCYASTNPFEDPISLPEDEGRYVDDYDSYKPTYFMWTLYGMSAMCLVLIGAICVLCCFKFKVRNPFVQAKKVAVFDEDDEDSA